MPEREKVTAKNNVANTHTHTHIHDTRYRHSL